MWPGRSWPLGATWGAEATNFAVYAPAATAVWVCLFEGPADAAPTETRHELTEHSLGIWHGAVPGVRRGQRYGFRADGPWAPAAGLRFNPDKLLLDPYARAVSGTFRAEPPVFGHVRTAEGTDLAPVRDERDSAPHMPRCVIVDGE